ncbi:MAG: sulfate transporter family protein [Pseudomonadota bacterium]
MLLENASLSFRQALSKQFRSILWRSLGLTLLLLVAVWVGLQAALAVFVVLPWFWLEAALGVVAGLGSLGLLGLLVAPVTALFAAIFQDEIADKVEKTSYPNETAGIPVPLGRSIALAVKFVSLVIIVNLISLILLLVPGVNLVVFFLANGYLLGREFFEFAAHRFHEEADVRRLRNEHGTTIFLGGLIIAGILAVPLLNLLTPIFATIYMVHVHKALVGSVRVRTRDQADPRQSS